MIKKISLIIGIIIAFFAIIFFHGGLYPVIIKLTQIEATDISECKMITLGKKPCGGPWDYLIYSTKTTNETILVSLVSIYNLLDGVANKISLKISTCDIEPAPEIILQDNQCKDGRMFIKPLDSSQ